MTSGRIALCCALAALGATGTAHAAEPQIIKSERVAERVVELTIATSAFTEPTKVHVDLPVGYHAKKSRRWPVTYVTAGTMNNYNTFNNFLDGENLMGDYPSIIVSPDGNSGYWSDWYNGGAFGPPMYETYVIEELIPLIDEHFRTLADRSHRAIFGISMGGYGALMLAAHNPDLFVAAASLSGAVDSNLPANGAVLSASSTFDGADADAIYGPRAAQEVRWRGHNPWDIAENLRDLDVQVLTANGIPNPAIGEGDGSGDLASCAVEGGVYMASVSLHERLNALGLPHLWKDYGPGCHTVPNFTREVLATLSVFEQVLANPPAPPKRFDYLSIEPRFSVWGWARPDRSGSCAGVPRHQQRRPSRGNFHRLGLDDSQDPSDLSQPRRGRRHRRRREAHAHGQPQGPPSLQRGSRGRAPRPAVHGRLPGGRRR